MKVLGLANLFVRVVDKDGKTYHFPELSVSSKDQDGNYKNCKLKCRFKKDVDINELDANYCYQIDVKDSILNVVENKFEKRNEFELMILEFDFLKESKINAKKENKKNPFKK